MVKKTKIVKWPESQQLTHFEGFLDNIAAISDPVGIEEYGILAYLVNEEWYDQLVAGKLMPIDADEYDRLKAETIKNTHKWIDIAYRDVDGAYYGD